MRRKKNRRAAMTGWYDPSQLAGTGLDVLVSGLFGHHADRRLLEALADSSAVREKQYYDFSDRADKDFWFDYIADVGDGFDSTYTMAYHLSRPELKVAVPGAAESHDTQPGKILIFGGDEVYPVATKAAYERRLVSPYNTAFPFKKTSDPNAPKPPAVFAIPGNHDWYDSLVSFSRLFCEQHKFAGWQTMQNRSYFALKLPRGWWLFGTDMQLGSTLDKPQIDYFSEVMEKEVARDDRIILCNAEPHWLKAALYDGDPKYDNRNMGYFEGHVLRHQVAVHIAGDLHNYRRHEEISENSDAHQNPRQKITAGGGGAFLHPTHSQDVEVIGRRSKFKLRKSFPEPKESKKLAWWNLLFPVWNPWFGLATGSLYLLTAKAFMSDLGKFGWPEMGSALATVAHDALTAPFALFWVLATILGFVLFTGSHSRLYRVIAGPIHAVVHLLAVFIISWQVAYLFSGLSGRGLETNSTGWLLVAGVLIFTGGWIIGSFIMGFYLLISLNIFRIHHNEAFSAIKIADYKNFVRFKIEENGDLVIFPLGVRRVVKKWKESTDLPNEPRIVPANMTEENKAVLLEPPVKFKRSSAAKTTSSGVSRTDHKGSEEWAGQIKVL